MLQQRFAIGTSAWQNQQCEPVMLDTGYTVLLSFPGGLTFAVNKLNITCYYCLVNKCHNEHGDVKEERIYKLLKLRNNNKILELKHSLFSLSFCKTKIIIIQPIGIRLLYFKHLLTWLLLKNKSLFPLIIPQASQVIEIKFHII